MAENTTKYKAVIETDVTPSIAELKKLQKELRTTTDPKRFKELQQQIDDTKDAISAAQTGAGNFAEILGTLPGPIGDIAAQAGGLVGTLKTFGQIKLGDIKGSFVDLGADVKDIVKGFGDLTGITKIYTTLNQALARSFVAVGVGEQAAATGARAFAAALTATGIGALVVGLGLLIANWDKVTDAIKGATAESKTYDEAQADVTKNLAEFNRKLIDVENAFEASKQGAMSKDEALKLYNDTLGKTVGFAGSLEQAEELLASNTAIVIEGIKLRTQANVFYAKSAEAAAKAVSGEDLDPSVWQTVGDYILSGGQYTAFATQQVGSYAKNLKEVQDNQKLFEAEGDKLTQKAIENDKKLKQGLETPPDNTKKDDNRKQELEAIRKNAEAALLLVMEAQDREVAIVEKKYEEEIALAKKYGKSIVELEAAREKELLDITTKFDKEREAKRKEEDARIKEAEDRRREERILAIENEIRLDDEKYIRLIAIANDKERLLLSVEDLSEEQRTEIRKQAAAERLQIQNERYNEQIANINEKEAEILSNVELTEAQRTQITIDAENARREAKRNELDETLLSLDTEFNALSTSFDRRRELINQKETLLLSDTQLNEAQRTAIRQQAADQRAAIDMAELDARASVQNAYLDLAGQFGSALQSLAGENKKLAIAGVVIEQAASVGRIIANTAVANAKAVAAIPLTAGQPFVTINTISAGLSIASSIAAAAKAIKQINATPGPSGGGGGVGGASASISAPIAAPRVAGTTAPEITGVGGGTDPTQQIAQTIAQRDNRPVKAYVVSGDVTSQQALDRRTNRAATFTSGG